MLPVSMYLHAGSDCDRLFFSLFCSLKQKTHTTSVVSLQVGDHLGLPHSPLFTLNYLHHSFLYIYKLLQGF